MTEAEIRVLLLAPRYPYPATRGDQRRVLNFVSALARRCTVRLLAFGTGPPLPAERITTVCVTRRPGRMVIENLRSADPRLPGQVRLYLDAGMRRAVVREAEHFRPHVLHATLSRMAPYLIPGPWHRHLDLVDPASLNMDSRARAMRWPLRLPFGLEARMAAAYETRAAAEADSVSVVSAADRARACLDHAMVIPIGVDETTFWYQSPLERPRQLIFFGNLGYFHNLEPANHAARAVLPLLRRDVPDASLRIVGARPAAVIGRLDGAEGVSVIGPVDRMVDELHQAAVALLPVFSGSGMQNKILEAFSAGTPVVTTDRALAPIVGVVPGKHCLVGRNAEALADACARLLTNPDLRVRIALEARQLSEQKYGVAAQADALLDAYGLGP